jgi:hypothetical protein
MPRRKINPDATPAPQAEAKPMSAVRAIRRAVILDNAASTEGLEAALSAQGFVGTKRSTIQTIRSDVLATLREAAELGYLKRSRRAGAPAEGETAEAA